MSIKLKQAEDFDEGLGRLIIEECETAIAAIENASNREEQHLAVHETRKAQKKIRACLRLQRFSINDYKVQNVFFRDLGRLISEIRDSTSHLETLANIKEQYQSRLYVSAFNKIEQDLLVHRAELEKQVFEEQNQLEHIKQALKAKVNELHNRNGKIKDFDDLKPGLKKVYKRGIKGLVSSQA